MMTLTDMAVVIQQAKEEILTLRADRQRLIEVGELAMNALINADDGDPTHTTGWASDESYYAYSALHRAIAVAKANGGAR